MIGKGTIVTGESGTEYRLGAELGRGGVGFVLAGVNVATGEKVAIKFLHPGRFPVSDAQRRRFEQEAAKLVAHKHPRLLKGLDKGSHEDSPFLVMQFLSKGTLRARARRDTPISTRIGWFCDLLLCFQALQENGVVHRDIKPNNFLIDDGDRVVLADFGIARSQGDAHLTGTGDVMGSLLYISEHQRRNPGDARPEDDFYSLSLVALDLLSGKSFHPNSEPLARRAVEGLPAVVSRAVDASIRQPSAWKHHMALFEMLLDFEARTLSSRATGSVPTIVKNVGLIAAEVINLQRTYYTGVVEDDWGYPFDRGTPYLTTARDAELARVAAEDFARGFGDAASQLSKEGVDLWISPPKQALEEEVGPIEFLFGATLGGLLGEEVTDYLSYSQRESWSLQIAGREPGVEVLFFAKDKALPRMSEVMSRWDQTSARTYYSEATDPGPDFHLLGFEIGFAVANVITTSVLERLRQLPPEEKIDYPD